MERDSIEDIIANSYKDFHVKGFDYICLKRSPEHTRKVYFFNGDVRHMPEVVNPHDHRYDFTTKVLSGAVENIDFQFAGDGDVYNQFNYLTPLNGGNGFEWVGETKLKKSGSYTYKRGAQYHLLAQDLHTIRIVRDGTVLMLDQYEAKVAVGQPTMTFCKGNEPPSLSGLYNKFTADQVVRYLKALGIDT